MILRFIFMFFSLNIWLFADSTRKLDTWYIGLSHSIQGTESASYFDGAENLSNTVGAGGFRNEIEIGVVQNLDKYGQTDLYKRMFVYAWQNDEEKNKEQGLGIGIRAGDFVTDNLAFTIGAKGGIGTQNVKGKTFITQSGTSNISYITNQSRNNPTPGRFSKDTNVLEIALLFDMDYFITDHINFNFGVSYNLHILDFSYELPNGQFAISSGLGQDNYQTKAGFNFNF